MEDISSRNLIVDSHSQQASWIDWDSLAVEDTLEPSESLYSTSSYLAPEKIFLGKNTCLAEVFALGALIYETILGRPLFSHGEKGIEESRYFTESKCLMLRIVPTYGELLVRALHPNPKKRYPSARDLQSQLQTILLKS